MNVKNPMFKKTLFLFLSVIFIFINAYCLANPEDNTNAADIYINAKSLLTELPKDFIIESNEVIKNCRNDVGEHFKEILSKNKEAINEFKKATTISRCEFNLEATIEDIANHFFKIEGLLNIARLILIEGLLYEKENKLNLAVEDYFSVLQFANHLGQQKKYAQTGKMGERILQDLTYVPLKNFIIQEKLDINNYSHILARFIFIKNAKVGLENAIKEERELRKYLLRQIDEKDKNRISGTFLNEYYKEIDFLSDEFCDRMLVAFKQNGAEKISGEFKKEYGLDKIPVLILSPVVTARVSFSLGLYYETTEISKYYISDTRFNFLILATAIKLYEVENNKFLSALNELAPKYLPEIPKDAFNNFNPLKYEKKDSGWIIYSFGPDREDNSGILLFNEENMIKNKTGDIVFSSP